MQAVKQLKLNRETRKKKYIPPLIFKIQLKNIRNQSRTVLSLENLKHFLKSESWLDKPEVQQCRAT